MSGGRFPQRIKRGSCVVSIYQTPTKGYVSFTVVHYDATGARCRRMFANYTKAREAATETAATLALGKPAVHVLTGNELVTYRRACQALYATGVELDVAMTQFAQAVKTLGDVPLSEVVNAYMSRKQPQIKRKLVSEVVQELLTAKRNKGRSALYIKDLRLRLERVAKAFPSALADLTPADIDKFLLALTSSPRTRNNFRQVIGTLLKFGQVRGYVANDHAGIGAVEKSSHTQAEVVVFTPGEINTLLRSAKQKLVPALAIGAFAGVRPEEIKRLDWTDVNLNEGHIEIRAANAKTRVRRLIPIQPNLRAWLLPHVQTSGPVQPFVNLTNQFLKAAGRAKVKWKRNGLRHSYISYRVAHTANIPAVSLEAGNSPQVISRNYLKCVTADEAQRWFGVMPNGG